MYLVEREVFCPPQNFCYILCYTLGVLGGSVTAVGQRIRCWEGGGRSCLFRHSSCSLYSD